MNSRWVKPRTQLAVLVITGGWWLLTAGTTTLMAQEPPPKDGPRAVPSHGFGPRRGTNRKTPGAKRRGEGPDRLIWQHLSAEDRQSLHDLVAEHFPERLDEFERAQNSDSGARRGEFSRVVAELLRLRDLRERDPEMFEVQATQMKIEFQLRRLVRRYRFSRDDHDRAKLKTEIRKLAAEMFDLRGVRMEMEIDELNGQLEHLQDVIKKRFANRDREIDQMVERMTEGGAMDTPRPRRGVRERLRRLRQRRGIDDPDAPPADPHPGADSDHQP